MFENGKNASEERSGVVEGFLPFDLYYTGPRVARKGRFGHSINTLYVLMRYNDSDNRLVKVEIDAFLHPTDEWEESNLK